ncbi:hypothetical protein GCM10010344_41320 [Streptomyces bluensis]|nr:hypothetical protein GCM10010344_41320 [Streptomyces bluensis]
MTDSTTAPVRDGLPTSDELIQAIALMQIPLDHEAIGLDKMTEDRRQAVLLGILNAWTQAYVSSAAALGTTPLRVEEYYMLVSSAQAEVSKCPRRRRCPC